MLEYPRQFMLFGIFQGVSAAGILVCYIGLAASSNITTVIGTLIYAAFTFPSFPIMMELIGKRVGKELDLVATGNVFFMTQIITAVMLQVFSWLIGSNTKAGSTSSFILLMLLLGFNLVLGILASTRYKIPFDKDPGDKY